MDVKASKRQKAFEGLNASENKDVISGLPDDIRVHILSFLSTKEAVRTSILSKGWICLWMSIGKFILEMGRPVGASHIHSFLLTVTRHKVRKLKLFLPEGEFVLPNSLFISKSLSKFWLQMRCTLKLPSSICFSRLKELNLGNIIFQDDRSTQQLFSGFPVLQRLTLWDCNWENIEEITIEIPTLRLLVFYQHGFQEDNFLNCKIIISELNLETLNVYGKLKVELSPHNLLSLDEASIDIDYWFDRQKDHSQRLLKLLCGIHKVKCLRLSNQTLESLFFVESIQGNLPSFYNLTMLNASGIDIHPNQGYTSHAIMYMLQKSPNLKSLILSKGFKPAHNGIPGCFQSCLKAVLLVNVAGDSEELCFLKYLYENAPVLKKLAIICSSNLSEDLQKQEEIRYQLQQLRGGSGCCRIEFQKKHCFL